MHTTLNMIRFYYNSGFMWSQYSINIFIYAYRSEQYRSAYWDIIVLLFPCLPKLKKQWEYYRKTNMQRDKTKTTTQTAPTKETAVMCTNPSFSLSRVDQDQ